MGAKVRHLLGRLDWLLVLGVGAITAFGLRMVDVATRDDIQGDPNFFAFRQLIYVAVGVGVMSIAMAIDLERLGKRPWTLWGALCGAVTVVLVVGSAARGSRRWIDFGVFQFQPSEIGKIGMIVILAGLLVERREQIGQARLSLLALGATAVPAFIVFVKDRFEVVAAADIASLLAAACTSRTNTCSRPRRRSRLRRWRTGRRKPLVAFQRTPAFWLTSK